MVKRFKLPRDGKSESFIFTLEDFISGQAQLPKDVVLSDENFKMLMRAAERTWLIYQLSDLLGHITDKEEICLSQKKKIVLQRWSAHFTEEAYKIGQILSSKTELTRLAGFKRNSMPRKWTFDLKEEVRRLFKTCHTQVKQAKKSYTRHKGSAAWKRLVAIEYPHIPKSVIADFDKPDKQPAEHAREWTAAILNSKYSDLHVSAERIKKILKTKTVT